MEPIIITAILKPKKGFEEQLLLELKKVQKASMEEAGCIKYDVHRSVEDHTFVLHEVWRDNKAIDSHIKSKHYQEYRENTTDIVLIREVYKLKTIQ